MRQFYETYRNSRIVAPLARQLKAGKRDPSSPSAKKVAAAPRLLGPVEAGASPNVSALLTQLPWTHHLIILGQSKRPEEREFYLRMAAKERWSSRQFERQFKAALFERVVLSPPKVSAALRQTQPEAVDIFRDAYTIEFLGLPSEHTENDLHRALLSRMKDFLLEFGRDFCFIGSEFPVQVGTRDFALDLLFFHRGLNCLVAFELKVERFEPEHLGKLNFYLEALDRDVRKPHEQPSISVDVHRRLDGGMTHQFLLDLHPCPGLV
jgi:predicted nuclease of restriction endonuclease-like (RecB) superfamily